MWWCNLEAGGGDALWGLDLATRKVVFRGEDGSVGFNRAFTLVRDVSGGQGLAGWLRVCAGTESETTLFLEAVRRSLL